MDTTVLALFSTRELAEAAKEKLAAAGFARDGVTVVTKDTPGRHEFLGAETSDLVRGATVGAVVGGVGSAIAGFVMFSPQLGLFGNAPLLGALLGGGLGAIAGIVIGLLIGSATGHQVQEEYEYHVESGHALVAVDTARAKAQAAIDVLRACGGTAISTSVHRHHAPLAQRA